MLVAYWGYGIVLFPILVILADRARTVYSTAEGTTKVKDKPQDVERHTPTISDLFGGAPDFDPDRHERLYDHRSTDPNKDPGIAPGLRHGRSLRHTGSIPRRSRRDTLPEDPVITSGNTEADEELLEEDPTRSYYPGGNDRPLSTIYEGGTPSASRRTSSYSLMNTDPETSHLDHSRSADPNTASGHHRQSVTRTPSGSASSTTPLDPDQFVDDVALQHDTEPSPSLSPSPLPIPSRSSEHHSEHPLPVNGSTTTIMTIPDETMTLNQVLE